MNPSETRGAVQSSDGASSDPAADAAHAAIDTAAQAAHPIVDKVAARAHRAVDSVAGAANQTADALQAKGVQLQEVQQRFIESAQQYMRERPLATIGIAVASGFLLSSLLRRRRGGVESMDDPEVAKPPAPEQGAGSGAAAEGTHPIDALGALWADLRGIASDQFGLAALEARRAGVSLVAILVLGLMLGLMLATAWLLAQAALVLELLARGASGSLALGVIVLLNLLGAGVLAWMIRRRSADLAFPATRRSLAPGAPPSD